MHWGKSTITTDLDLLLQDLLDLLPLTDEFCSRGTVAVLMRYSSCEADPVGWGKVGS